MRIKNLAGVFTGDGFLKKKGRNIATSDMGFVKGPVDIVIDASKGKIKEITTSPGNDTDVFDGSGLVATAGFVDSHTHAIFAGNRAHEFFMRWQGKSYVEISEAGGGIKSTFAKVESSTDAALEDVLMENARSMLRHGSTTVEVKSGYGRTPEVELRLLKAIKRVSSLPGLPALHATFLGLHALPQGEEESSFVAKMQKILQQVAQEKLASSVDAFPEKGFFSLESAQEFCLAAKQAGLSLKIHADEITDMKAVETFVSMGALSVDHLQKVNGAGLAALGKSGCVATLLPATSFFLKLEYAPARKLLNAGARVALATDFNPGTAPESSFSLTQYLAAAEFRMTPSEILCASTYNGAAALGQDQSKGILAPGYQADLLLWKTDGVGENSLSEIFALRKKPEHVLLKGRHILT